MPNNKVLYLGLSPPPGVFHYPVIRTEKIEGEAFQSAQRLWPTFTHAIFTSKTAVRYWFETERPGKQIVIAIGDATAFCLKEIGICPLIASESTQEGVIALLDSLSLSEAYLFMPRSKLARGNLILALEQRAIRFFPLDLYNTVLQKLEPVPSLSDFDEIVFTSPSTVEGFLQVFGTLPRGKILTPIGPITRRAIEAAVNQKNEPPVFLFGTDESLVLFKVRED